ncbi:MAG: glycerophosphodiester phosphodiesterase family protein, partial [Alphaproteobacteria bacterium]|nr:glycerophosphodiester phosphodiesterase family protein [Alphaproteobacteria bacterium]
MAPVVIGHRGASALAPENTLATLREAHRAGLSWVELDAMLTADRTPVVFHDHRLERLTGANGLVSRTPSEAVVGLPVLGGRSAEHAVPRLGDALQLVAALGLNLSLEIKVNRLGRGAIPE